MNHFNQTEDDIREFAKGLPLMNNMNNINSTFYEMLPLCGFGPAIAFSRFLVLQQKIAFGKHSLINAYRKDHKSIWRDDLEASLLERSLYFENAIEAYNKVVDYVYGILYFKFELYEIIDKEKIKTKEDIIRISKNIKGRKLDEIRDWIILNESKSEFFKKFDDYRCETKEMRNLANDMKHRGCIAFEGIELPRNTKVTKVIDGNKIDITDLVSALEINLDSEIEKLSEIHRHTIKLQMELFTLCDFEKTLTDFLVCCKINVPET